jgi:pimeloyl-ACP methyl ester carboxylesterase
MKIYLLPGLGADKRMYEQQLKVLPGAEVIEHLKPVEGQSLTDYAGRVADLIDTRAPFILIGTSLGGIVSLELSRIISPQKIILIASVKCRSEMPGFIRAMKYLKLHKLISGKGYKSFNNLMVRRLDSRGDSPAAEVIKAMTRDTSPEFIEWAIDAVINWTPPQKFTTEIVHIHGTADQLFPFSNIRNAIPVQKGSHVMNMTKADEVNQILLEVLNK